MRIEIRAGEGGADASTFAHELATAISKHSRTTPATVGTALVLDRL